MKKLILICAFAAACATTTDDGKGLPEVDSEASSSADDRIDVGATDGLERIDATTAAALHPDCHGTTTCPGGVDLGGGWVNTACGPQVCGNHSCGPGDRTSREQAHELHKAYSVGGQVCIAYKPTFASYGACSCEEIID